jgi:L-threonylcarbamoyladenylate synthase
VIVGIAAAAERLRAGEVVAYPTETVYGLGADATSEAALARLRRLKGRAPTSGLSVLVEDLARLEKAAPELPAAARRLAERFWPGPLTLVVSASEPALARIATPDGVGFRCSSHPTARALVRAAGLPIVSTSCNRSGEPPCMTAQEAEAVFGAGLPVAGGEAAGGAPPSTVVAVGADGELRVLREGAIAPAHLREEVSA